MEYLYPKELFGCLRDEWNIYTYNFPFTFRHFFTLPYISAHLGYDKRVPGSINITDRLGKFNSRLPLMTGNPDSGDF